MQKLSFVNAYYTGVGSRETPKEMLNLMTSLAVRLRSIGLILRSGCADGADSAFERGAGDFAHLYLPWPGFSRSCTPRLKSPSLDAYRMASQVHPGWFGLSAGAKSLHARNCHQVLGDDLVTPSLFLICWTGDGCVSELTRTKTTGGTATAIILAERNNIPIFNLRQTNMLRDLEAFLEAYEQL